MAEGLTPATSLSPKRRIRWREIRESITGCVFVLPAFIIIAVFGLIPILFSVYVSLHKWRIKPGRYLGLENYFKALDNLAYVVIFWVAIVFIFLAARMLFKLNTETKGKREGAWLWFLPGLVTAGGVAAFVRFVVILLPEVLSIADKVKGQARSQAIFVGFLGEAWRVPAVQSSLRTALLILAAGLLLAYLIYRFMVSSPQSVKHYPTFILFFILLGSAILLGGLTWFEIQRAYAEALAEGGQLEIWPQVITISAGFVLLLFSWFMWRSAGSRETMAGTLLRIGAAIVFAVVAWALIGELNSVIAAGDDDWWQGLLVTVYYSIGTVPLQLGISLFLATLLFQEIKAKGFYRLIYFLPYITPAVAAAAVFRVFFSSRASAPINSLLTRFGGEPLLWLDEPKGLIEILAGANATLAEWLPVGPSLALVVIIIYNVWSYVGYDTVIFLAGLGGIPGELYEAASIDGAGKWAQFRNVTLPLLSPTTYFLTLLAVIGTFKAFNHVWVLRKAAALGTTDTASIMIFVEFNRNTRYGYSASLALILLIVILILTIINNRIAEERVFYG